MTKVMSAIFVLLIFELTIFGPVGIVIGDVAVRKWLIALLLLMSFHHLLTVGWLKIWQIIFLFGLTFFVFLWGVFVPLLNDVPQSMSFAEVTPLAGLFLIVPIQQLFEKYGPMYYFGIVRWAGFALASIVILTWGMVEVMGQFNFGLAVRELYISINQTDAGIYIGPMRDGSFRVMFIGCMVLPFLLAYHNWNAFSFGWSLFYLIAIYATGTRAFLLAGVCIVGIALLLRGRGLPAVILAIVTVTFPTLLSLLEGKRIFDFASEFTTESARYLQFFSLMNLFFDYPLLGAGFGAHTDVIRSEDAPYSYELTYVALLAKLGLIGAALTLIWAGNITVSTLSRFPKRRLSIIGVILAFILMTATNPYLINSLGMIVVAFLVVLAKHGVAEPGIHSHLAGQQRVSKGGLS